MATISTPCTRVCVLDPRTGLCQGCGRTGDEIARWGGMSEEARLAVMAGLAARRQALAAPGIDRPAESRA